MRNNTNPNHTSRFWWKSAAGAFLLLIGMWLFLQWSGAIPGAVGAPLSASARVAQVWDNVRNSTQYDFSADVEIKTIPLPTMGNIGRFSKTDSLYLEGSNSLKEETLQMAMWGGGVSVADRANAYQMRVQDGDYQTRAGDGEWQASKENALAFAPEGNFLAFLDMAKNVKVEDSPHLASPLGGGTVTGKEAVSGQPTAPTHEPVPSLSGRARVGQTLTHFSFDLDSKAYAQKIVRMTQEQLVRSGELPVGAALQTPDHLAKMTGTGELWVDERGLPVRQRIFLSMPPAPGADNRSETVMDIYFTEYHLAAPVMASAPWLQPLLQPIARINLPEPSTMAINFTLFAVVMLGMAALIRPGRTLQTVMTIFVVFCIVITPALQAQASTLAMDRYTARQSGAEEQERSQSLEQQMLDARKAHMAAPPYQPQSAAESVVESVSAAASAQLSNTADSDGDRLNDALEQLNGTDPYSPDSDLDSVSDYDEVTGFSYAGKTWYGNPMLADSNQDMIFDGLEWNPRVPDLDQDLTPDLYDYDDDGDGVPDEVDISSRRGVRDNLGTPVIFNEANPLELTVEGLHPWKYTYVDLQVRPTNPARLWYAFNVLNWPKDQKGNAQDWDGATYYDHCVATGGSNCNMATEGNGDLKLVPMLEVTVPDLSNLPRKGDGTLDQPLLDRYGIAVQPAGDGSWLLYVPLMLTEDPLTENRVAFNATLLYQASGAWKPQQARLVWAVNLLNEQYESTKVAEETLKKSNGKGKNQITILHTYYDDFQLTGMNVREDHGVEMAIVYEDPAVDTALNDDDALYMMTVGLQSSYFVNRDCDLLNNNQQCVGNGQRDITLDTIAQRWNRTTNSGITDEQRWGIGNYLRVERRSYTSQDEATMVGGGAHTTAILNASFKNTPVSAPTLLFVQESRLRTLNTDGGVNSSDVTWNGSQLKFILSSQTLTAVGSYRLAPYRQAVNTTGWEIFPTAAYADEVIKRYDSRSASTQPNATPEQVELANAEANYAAINVTMNIKGQSEVLSTNAGAGAYPTTLFNFSNTFQSNLNDRDLRFYYTQAASELGSRLVWMSVVGPGAGGDHVKLAIKKDVLVQLFRLQADSYSHIENDNFRKARQDGDILAMTKNSRIGLAAFNALLFVAGLSSIFALSMKSKGAQTAGEAIALSVGAVSAIHDAALTAAQVATKLPALANNATPLQKLGQGAKLLFGVNSTIAKIGAIGAAIGIGVTWLMFFVAWGTGGLDAGSIGFNTLLAGAIAGTIIVVLTFILSLAVVGAIILAIVAVFDLFTFIACKAGAKKACDISIMGYVTKALTDAIYSGGVMIDTSGQPPIATVKGLKMRLTTPKRGLVAGNGVQFEAKINTLVRHLTPEPGAVYFNSNFFTEKDIRSTSVKYALGPQQPKLKTTLNQTQWGAAAIYDTSVNLSPSPVVGWLVPVLKSKNLWLTTRDDTLLSPVYPFGNAQINQSFPMSLTIAMALPTYNCWFGVCKHNSMRTTTYEDLGESFVLDILPATLDEFVKWDQLGLQIDLDGDGVNALRLVGNTHILFDPDDTKADTDGDGIPDGVELRNGLDPKSATGDADGDGLVDRDELYYGASPRRADTDGDGLNDGEEVNGYPLTINSLTTQVTSNPNRRDTDGDGMSDGVEHRLNLLNSVRYPYHPRTFNDPPVRLYMGMTDADRILAVGASTIVTSTVVNGTAVVDGLLSAGIMKSALPAQLGGATQQRTFTLLPDASANILLNATAGQANGEFFIRSDVSADVAPVGTTPSGVPDDIIYNQFLPVTIDSDPPNVPALTAGSFVQPGYTVIIGGSTSDPTSYIAKVEASVNGSAYTNATGTDLWAFPVAIPNNPSGSVPVTVRALDAVNNSNSANFNLTIDGVAPVLTVNLSPGTSRQVRRNAAGKWTLRVDGTVSDALSGMDTLTVQIGDSSNAVLTRTAIAGNGSWSLDYAFDDLKFNADPRPTGNYTLTVTARDTALPNGNALVQEIPFVIDMTPPTVTLRSHRSEEEITDGAVFTGTVQDANSPVQSVEVAFVSASTALSTGVTLLRLPLNDLPESVIFENTAAAQTNIYCLDDCPTSAVNGIDGSAARFGGDDLLRSFDTIDLPESEFTTALWFNTTCANCGLFSTVQGEFPTITESDRELYLDAGKVCSSILVGNTRDTRCTADGVYADGQWHHVVHTLGANGNALYIDGKLAVRNNTMASTFTAQDHVLVGYAHTAGSKFLTGTLDDLVIYEGALSAEAAASLYRQWRPVNFNNGQWSFTVPEGLEGTYQIDMRASDTAGNYGNDRSLWAQFRGPIDTAFPTFDVNVNYSGAGAAAQTTYSANVRDNNLTQDQFRFTCPANSSEPRYNLDPTRFNFAGASDQLMGLDTTCQLPGFGSNALPVHACDEWGHCGAATAPQIVAYIGTRSNRLLPSGKLPNAIERTVLSDPDKRVQIIERPGQIVTDIAIDESRGKIYWGELQEGDYAQPGQIWRANLDGSGMERLVNGLTVSAPEALQIALDSVGNKLYWTKRYQLWWANLDGTQAQVIYQIAADSGLEIAYRIGDVAIDRASGSLYLSESRQRLEGNVNPYLRNHSLIVRTQLNGSNPSFVAGAGTGCTYANFYDNLGRGVGAGKDPTACVQSRGGMDVESLFVVDGTLYWSAFDEGRATSGVYSLANGGGISLFAPLALGDEAQGDVTASGIRGAPLPHLYVASGSPAVFAMLQGQVVRGEPGAEFTQFSLFSQPSAATSGASVRRDGSRLTAMTLIRTPQAVQTSADLAVTLTSPDLVVLDGQRGSYNVQVNNNSGLHADNTVITLTLPSNTSYAGSTLPVCTANGSMVTCQLGTTLALDQQSIGISYTVAVNAVQTLNASVQVGHRFADLKPSDNSSSHSNVTASPLPTVLPGTLYLYGSYQTRMVRVPLFGNDRAPEMVDLENSLIGGYAIAVDRVRNKLILNNNIDGDLATVNPDGSNYQVIASTVPGRIVSNLSRLAVAVDEAEGRVYWTEVNLVETSSIRSSKVDGSDLRTHVTNIRNQSGLLFDTLRRKLLWVGMDRSGTQNTIYRSNLDGSEIEIVYSAPPGSQIRYLSQNPYTQKLYWIDPETLEGTLFQVDGDGGRVTVLHDLLGKKARGIVVLPAENQLYFIRNNWLVRTDLDGGNLEEIVEFSGYQYPKVSNRYSSSFVFDFVNPPVSNLVVSFGSAFPPPPCTIADGNEPNDTQAQATGVGVGSFSASLCQTLVTQPSDQDVYSVTVPVGKQVTVTLQSPAGRDVDINLLADGYSVDASQEARPTLDVVTVANYDGAVTFYNFTVFDSYRNSLNQTVALTNAVHIYTVTVTMADAPPQTVFTNAQCAAVDSHDAPGAAGNGSQGNATPLTLGQPITGALCYQFDQDFYKFNAQSGQQLTVDLPVRPDDYSIYVYRPNGTLFNGYNATGAWRFGTPFTLDASGEWAVAVAAPELPASLAQYQLLVTDISCGINDSYEPNNVEGLAASINGQSRVNATLCSASDQDYYQFSATAGQKLTLNYPVNGTGGTLVLQSSAGATLGQVAPGTQGTFTLANAGTYRLLVTKSDLSGNDVPYMFQWLLDAPTVSPTATNYVYYADHPHLVRVALSEDHTVEPILIDSGNNGQSLAAATLSGKLYMVETSSQALVSVDMDGRNRTVIVADANPDDVSTINIAVAVDELGGRIYWLQPKGSFASTAVDLMSANLSGGDVQTLITGAIFNQRGLWIDSVKGLIYWISDEAIYRSRLDGSDGAQLVRAAVVGEQVRDLAIDPFAQQLYWLDPSQGKLQRANSDGSDATTLRSGLNDTRGLALRPLDNELYLSSGDVMLRASLDASSVITIAALSGQYQGPSNLNPNNFLFTPIGTPESNLVLGAGSPILSPCLLADSNEPNNSAVSAKALTVVTETVIYGALCNSTVNAANDTDYFTVTVPASKTLAANLTQLPADYRLVIIHPDGYAAAYSENEGLADESGVITNSSGSAQVYTLVVLNGFPINNYNPYKLSLAMGDVPPPPNPGDPECGAVDSYDSPGVGNGTLATASALSFGAPAAGALCYANDVDMYAFDGLAGQMVSIDLPTRPQDYNLTLYNPAGAPMVVISSTTSSTYGASVTLISSGRYTLSVSQPNLTPTTAQYQLLVTDENCVASDANEPNNSATYATSLSNGSRIRASLCSSSDVDLYRFTANAGQELILNYPANATGATLQLSSSGGAIGTVTAGAQGKFTIGTTGTYSLSVSNNSLSSGNVAYRLQLLLGAPSNPPTGTPYIYYSRVSELIRADVLSGTVEPILTDGTAGGGRVIAADTVRGKLYILTFDRRIDQVDFDGRNRTTVVATVNPNNVLRPTESLAVDELSGRIYWTESLVGGVARILSANGNGMDVREVVATVVAEHGIAVDSVAGLLYWTETDTFRGQEVIRRSNLDGSDAQTIYAAPVGRQIRELALDPFAQKLYWRDPSQNRLFWIAAEGGSEAEILRSVGSVARGFVVRALENELYFNDGSALLRSALDGSNAQVIARLEGAYNGVSNLDSNIFYPTLITPPGSENSDSNLVLGYNQPFAQSCAALDLYEPNDSIESATAIGLGTIQSVLCMQDLNRLDMQDHYSITVPAGKQISATLSNLPQDYGLTLYSNGQLATNSFQPGLANERVIHVNNNATPATYTLLVQRFADTTSSRLPYSLTVAISDAPPPPPPPPPPPDSCAPIDPYDQPGLLGNWNASRATSISFNTPITAALCYAADKDTYSFDGQIGQNVTLDLPARPADYYVTLYDPAGNYFNGIFPGSWLTYGDSVTLNASGRWTVVVWYPNLAATSEQYQLLLSVNSTCSGLDPYEPNDSGSPTAIVTPTMTLRAMLCELPDRDSYSFPVQAGQRVRITPRSLTPGMWLEVTSPSHGYFEVESYDRIMRDAGEVVLIINSQEPIENLPYVLDVQIDPVPVPTLLPNNWSCAVYPSTNIPLRIDDLVTLASTVNVPVNGTVTHVGIKDLTYQHSWSSDLAFGLQAPDGTFSNLFSFDATGESFGLGCDSAPCSLSLDDGAVAGLIPPRTQTGGTYAPNLSTFAGFNGKASHGNWTLLVRDDGRGGGGCEGECDTPGDLISWGLEVCVDNGNPPTPPPTPTATPTPEPQPTNGTPVVPPPTQTEITPIATATACTLTADEYENDDTPMAAASFDLANQNNGVRSFDSLTDSDWMTFTVFANLRYTFDANLMSGADSVTLSLYDVDGTTHLATGENRVSYDATADGIYYLRAKSAAGIVSPCNTSYSIALTVINPNVTPVPTPTGTPLPPGHEAPPLSAAVLQPADSTVITNLLVVAVEIGLNAELGINGAELLMNESLVESYPPAPSSKDATWMTSWTPTQAGVYSFRAEVKDTANVTATSKINVVYVDLADPTVSITAETITLAKLESDGSYLLKGTTSDDSQVGSVEVRLDGREWQLALLDGNSWSLALSPASATNIDGGTLAIEARATDKAGRSASANETILVDITPPDPFEVTTTLLNGTVISASQVISTLSARINWAAANGAVSIHAGWTVSSTATLGELTAYGAGAGNHVQTMPEASAMFAHVIAVDNQGNQRAVDAGPFYFDSAATPDLIADLNIDNWIDSGGKQVGQMVSERGVQKLFAGWNATHLRLRWQGVNPSAGDDLYFYLGTGGGGSSDLFNPNGANQTGLLPFAATYMVRLADGITPTLYSAGGGWSVMKEVTAVNSGELNDVLLPFSDLGISNPGVTSLKVLGVAASVNPLDVWATLPDQNLGRPWAQYVEFASLGSGIVPATGVWDDTLLEVIVTADPASDQLVGVGDAVSVTVQATNVGSATLPSLNVAGMTSGGVSLNNSPQVASNIVSSGTVELTLNGTINGDGEIVLRLADSYHRPYLLQTLSYRVDVAAPISVTLVVTSVNPGINTVFGTAEDESSIASFDLEVNGTLTPCVPAGGGFACEWNAGNAAENTVFTLRGRATDVHGNAGWSGTVAATVDATAPQLTLSGATLAALSDGRISNQERTLTGALTDNVAPDLASLCLDDATSNCTSETVQPDNSWTLIAPALGDGVTSTVSFVGYDLAGNASQATTATVVIDSVSPQFGSTTVNQSVYISNNVTLFGNGTVTDGSGVASVQTMVVRPDGSSTVVPAMLNGTDWAGSFLFDQVGIYQIVVVATDLAGNKSVQVIGEIDALYAELPPQNVLLTVRVVGSGVVAPTTSSYLLGTVVPITATANNGWSFANWSGDLNSTDNPTTITMNGNKTITATFTTTAPPPPGDVNGDSEVNVIDLQMTINMILHSPALDPTLYSVEAWQRADLNGDGEWNVIDLQMLINLILSAPTQVSSELSASSQDAGNRLTLEPVIADAGSSGTISLLLDNVDPVASGQVRFTYDVGLGITITGVQMTDRGTGFESIGSAYPTGDPGMLGYQLMFYNLNNLTVAPGSGAILRVSYTTSAATGSSALRFTQAILASPAAQSLTSAPVDGALTVGPLSQRLYLPVIQR